MSRPVLKDGEYRDDLVGYLYGDVLVFQDAMAVVDKTAAIDRAFEDLLVKSAQAHLAIASAYEALLRLRQATLDEGTVDTPVQKPDEFAATVLGMFENLKPPPDGVIEG